MAETIFDAVAGSISEKAKVYWKSSVSSITLGAGVALETTLASKGMTPPAGYSILSMNYVVTGTGTVADAEAHWQGMDGQVVGDKWALVLKNVGSSSRTWTLRIVVWYIKDDMIQELGT